MLKHRPRLIFVSLTSLLLSVGYGLGSQNRKMPDDATGRKIMPLRAMLQSEDEASLRRFIKSELAAKAREGRSEQELLEMLGGLRKELAGARMRGALKLGPYSAKLVLVSETSENVELHYEVDPEPPHGILKLSISSEGARPDLPGVEDHMSDEQIPSKEVRPEGGIQPSEICIDLLLPSRPTGWWPPNQRTFCSPVNSTWLQTVVTPTDSWTIARQATVTTATTGALPVSMQTSVSIVAPDSPTSCLPTWMARRSRSVG